MTLDLLKSSLKEVRRMESEWAMIYPHPNHPIFIRRSRSGPNLYLRIGTGTRCRKAILSAAEFRTVGNALLSSAEKRDEERDHLTQKAQRSR
jgi:hypothetical protein